jgi:S-layer protein
MTAANKTTALAGPFGNIMTILGNQVKSIVVGGDSTLGLTAASTALTSLDASSNTVGSTGLFVWSSGATTSAVNVKGLATGINTIDLSAATVAGTYTGSANGDTVTIGNALANVLNLGNGTNLVQGVASGNNVVTGGADADTFVTATTGNNVVNFGDGANAFTATSGNNQYTGGAGVDTVIVTTGNNTISTDGGNDAITVGSVTTVGINNINVGSGTDSVTIIGQSVNGLSFSTITGLAVGDTLVLQGGNAGLGTPTFTTARLPDLGAPAVFTDYLASASTSGTDANSNISWFTFGGNTFIVEDNSTLPTFQNGVDSVGCLTGTITVNGANLAVANQVTFTFA